MALPASKKQDSNADDGLPPGIVMDDFDRRTPAALRNKSRAWQGIVIILPFESI